MSWSFTQATSARLRKSAPSLRIYEQLIRCDSRLSAFKKMPARSVRCLDQLASPCGNRRENGQQAEKVAPREKLFRLCLIKVFICSIGFLLALRISSSLVRCMIMLAERFTSLLARSCVIA